jgi:C-terminal processing protease CtpA/Prc
MRSLFIVIAITSSLISCRSTRDAFAPTKKFAPAVLQKDYTIFRQTLEEHHPGIYWYTPKQELDYYFDQGFAQLKDSMTEASFRKILTYVTAQIKCGHTTVRWSKEWSKYLDTTRQLSLFPLSVKIIGNQAVVTGNLHRKDAVLTTGTELVSINGRSVPFLIDTLVKYISLDGGNRIAKAQWLSNRGNFGSLYGLVFGTDSIYQIEYIDDDGKKKSQLIKPIVPIIDTGKTGTQEPAKPAKKPSKATIRKQNRDRIRQLQIDTVSRTAFMRLSSFGKGYKLSSFFRRSFKELQQRQIRSLIIDVRNNGGGIIRNSTLLTRYITDSSFKIADTLVATKVSGTHDRHLRFMLWYKAAMLLVTQKKKDGLRHFTYYERHRFTPKIKNHFNGNVYLITGGNSYSATSILANKLSGQPQVTIVGEETGGAAYGNSAWMMPKLVLPGTKLSIQVPLYRFVMDKTQPKDGSGIQPTYSAIPTIKSIRENKDVKMEVVLNLIRLKEQKQEF